MTVWMFNYSNEIHVIKEFHSGHVSSYSDTGFVPKWGANERDRIRTCNPQIRSLMPYPLGHTPCTSKWFKYFITFPRTILIWHFWLIELKLGDILWINLTLSSGWPSGLRRCVQVAVHLGGRGFKSHSWQLIFDHFIKHKFPKMIWFSQNSEYSHALM